MTAVPGGSPPWSGAVTGVPGRAPARGAPTTGLEMTGTTKKRGTKVTFKPDTQIFETTDFSFDTLAQRLRELAFLNGGVTITIDDERDGDGNGEQPGQVGPADAAQQVPRRRSHAPSRGRAGAIRPLLPSAALMAKPPATYDLVLKYVRSHTGHDFSNYKRATILRRIA